MKVNLVKTIAKICSQGFYRNLFGIFLSVIKFSMHFGRLYQFMQFLNREINIKKWGTMLGSFPA
jgi:hypothetical protein